jgi:hypothetical protein
MSLKDCIRASRAAGEITLEEAQALEKRYDAIARQVLSPASAKQQLAAELEAEAFEKKRRALLTESVRQQVDQDLLAHRNRSGQQDPAEALQMMLEHFGQGRMQDVEHRRLAILGSAHAKLDGLLYEMRKGAVAGDLRRRTGATKARLENIVREVHGEGTSDAPAKEMATALTEVFDDLRQRANAAGAAIGKLEYGYMPTHWNPEALLRAGREQFVKDAVEEAHPERWRHPLTGKTMSKEEIRESAKHVWETVTTDGWLTREPGQGAGKGALFKQHNDHRFMHWKDADAWLRMQRNYGEGDPFAAAMAHISTMSRDIAFMEALGPNPDAMFKYAKDRVMKMAAEVQPRDKLISEHTARIKELSEAFSGAPSRSNEIVDRIDNIHREIDSIRSKRALGGPTKRGKKKIDGLVEELSKLNAELLDLKARPELDQTLRGAELQHELRAALDELADLDAVPFPANNPIDRAKAAIRKADNMWEIMRGTANSPTNSRIANGLSSFRNIVSASSLGAAQLSAFSDLGFQALTRTFVGIPARAMIGDVVSMFGKESRREAVRAGLILDSSVHVMHQQARYVGSVQSRSVTGYMVDRVIHLQGLAAWTQAGKHAFGMAFQAEMADRVGLALDKLPPALRRTLERHGITAGEWDQIRTAALYEPKAGSTFLRPNEIANVSRPLAEKYLSMIMRETRFAVPEGTVASRLTLTQGTSPGTLMGEIARNFAQFKSFGVAVAMLHTSRIAREIGAGRGLKAVGLYGGALLITSGVLGGLSLQLKELANGRDPRDMNPMSSPEFWGAAIMQGGGFGIYGDFLFNNLNRFGGGIEATIAGPATERISSMRNLILGNVAEGVEGKTTNVGREAVRFAGRNLPGSSLWYARLAFERVVLDQMQHMVDPEARAAFKKRVQNRKKTYGNDFWWKPGDAAPARAPDLSSAVGP